MKCAKILLALCLLTSSTTGQSGDHTDRASRLVVAAVEPWRGLAALQSSLVALGPDAAPELFGLLVEGQLLSFEGEPFDLPLRPRLAIQGALGAQRPVLRALLDDLGSRDTSERERAEAFALLRRFGRAGDVHRVIALTPARPGADATEAGRIKAAFEQTLSAVARNDPQGPGALRQHYASLPPDLRAPLVRAVASVEGPRATEALGRLLGLVADMDPYVLQTLGTMLEEDFELSPETLDKIRRGLWNSDATTRRLCIPLLLAVRDHESIPALIDLLDGGDPEVRSAAHDALWRMTRVLHGPDEPRQWRIWHADEMRWWSKQSAQVAEGVSGDLTSATQAIREISRHRLHPEQLGKLLLPAFQRSEPEILELASWAVAVVGSRGCFSELVGLLEHETEAVRRSAWEALRWLTKNDLPLDAAAWRIALDLQID